jgi:kynurenine formamidase
VIARAGLRVVDLAQTLSPDTAVWPGLQPLAAVTTNTYADGGSYGRQLTFHEHTGTHLDAPAHFHEGGTTVEGIDAGDLVCDAAVIDIREACAGDADYALSGADIAAHEAEHGTLPRGSAVLVCTGWSAHRSDAARYVGDMRFPGLSADAGRKLVERRVAGIGIDTLSTDRGIDGEFPVHFIALPAGLWQLEGLVNLELLPPRGALLVVGAPRLGGGSGVPARPLALLPAQVS